MRHFLYTRCCKRQSILHRFQIHSGIFTADIANAMVMKDGIPFRDAYKKAAGMDVGDVHLMKNVSSKKTLGAPGNLGLLAYRRRIRKVV